MPSVARKKSRIPAVMFMLTVLAAGSASGATGSDGLPSESFKVALLEWIGANSGYDVSAMLASPPKVSFCKHGSTLVYKGKAIHFDDRLNGVYDETTEQICLAEPWDASNIEDAGILLHELVHHVQYQTKAWPCPKATEWEAYKLQEAWLHEMGVKPAFSWMYILMASSCTPRDVHP